MCEQTEMVMKFWLSWPEREGAATESCTMSHLCELIKKKESREKIMLSFVFQ